MTTIFLPSACSILTCLSCTFDLRGLVSSDVPRIGFSMERQFKGSVGHIFYWIWCQLRAWRIETDNLKWYWIKIFWPGRQNTFFSNILLCVTVEILFGYTFMNLLLYSICASLHTSFHLCQDLSSHVRLHACCCRELSLLDCYSLS